MQIAAPFFHVVSCSVSESRGPGPGPRDQRLPVSSQGICSNQYVRFAGSQPS